jgi:signal transduction histidine kinase
VVGDAGPKPTTHRGGIGVKNVAPSWTPTTAGTSATGSAADEVERVAGVARIPILRRLTGVHSGDAGGAAPPTGGPAAGETVDYGAAATTLRFERVRPVERSSRWVGRARADEQAELDLRRRQISHDIHHELGTIMMLASLLSCSPDVGEDSRQRARQIVGEARWLDQLQRAYEDTLPSREGPATSGRPSSIRLDTLAAEIVAAMQLSTVTQVSYTGEEAWARTDQLEYWRAVRNVVGNAVRAAGPVGHVRVAVGVERGWVVTQVDDDGPGFGGAEPGLGALGLGIVRDAMRSWGGGMAIADSELGGCSVRLKLPVASPNLGELGLAV